MNSLYSDNLETLPSDLVEPLEYEKTIINNLFGSVNKNKELKDELKRLILMFVLFIVFSFPIFTTILEKILPISNKSVYIAIILKGILFVGSFWIINNFALGLSIK